MRRSGVDRTGQAYRVRTRHDPLQFRLYVVAVMPIRVSLFGRKTCRVCGDAEYRQAYCRYHYFEQISKTYYMSHPTKTVQCKICSKEFETTRSAKIYCSRQCAQEARYVKDRKTPKAVGELYCSQCENAFTPIQGKCWLRFCSSKCKDKKYGSLKPKSPRKTSKVISTCNQCGVEFEYRRYAQSPKRLFCSRKCCYKHNSGNKGRLRRDGRFHFLPSKEWQETRKLIISRDGHACVICKTLCKRPRVLCVDHIVPRRFTCKIGCDPHQISNLATLCRTCHGKKTMTEVYLWKEQSIAKFVSGLMSINYPMDFVRTAFGEYGISTLDIDRLQPPHYLV